jgi:hypothetical protein
MSHDWSWSDEQSYEEHHLVLKDFEERAVRAYIYNAIGRSGEFVLYFEDLKFSDPVCLVHGYGFITFNNTLIKFKVHDDHTVLTSHDQKSLVSIVVAAIDAII